MSYARLLENYQRIADAPDAIVRFRRFIFDLAVRGKLVPQDPSDEPVSKLIERIASERQRRGRQGKGKVSRIAQPTTDNSVPVQVPNSWGWIRVSELGLLSGGLTPSMARADFWNGEVVWLSPKDIKSDEVFDSELKITEKGLSETNLEVYPAGSLFMVARSGILKRTFPIAINRVPAAANQDMKVLVPFVSEQERYLQVMFRGLTTFILRELVKSGTTVQSLKYDEFADQLVPIPPLAEQHRIVAKVDELMALCDKLENARRVREAARDRFAAASLARLNAPDSGSFQRDAGFAVEHLASFTARPDQIKQLRQAILNLAVQGKLVPHDPRDESAAELLMRIATAKIERKRKSGDPRIRVEPSPEPSDLRIPLPSEWGVQSFANLFLFIDYRGKTPSKTDSGIPLITAKNIRMGHLNREPREYVSATTFNHWMTRGFPERGDLLFTTEAPLANVCLNEIDEPFALAQRVICLQPYAKIDTKFVMAALMSEPMQALIDAHATGLTAKGIKAAKLKPLPIPVPPLAEQHRIAAKVEELMTLTDRLERRLAEQAVLRSRLLGALLTEGIKAA